MRFSLMLAASGFCAAAALAGCGAQSQPGGGSGISSGDKVRVVRVVDGDTIVVAGSSGATSKVRYIGVDTPETVKPNTPVQCFGKKASSLNKKMVAGRMVILQFDRERTDRYGRLLAYVKRSDGLDVNAQLLALGAARTMEIQPNTSRASSFRQLQSLARRSGKGLWKECFTQQSSRSSLVLSTE
jgi:micrococcal nuclease